MDRNKNKALIKVTIQFPGEEEEWGAANYFDPDEMDLNEVFKWMRVAFERAFEKEKNVGSQAGSGQRAQTVEEIIPSQGPPPCPPTKGD